MSHLRRLGLLMLLDAAALLLSLWLAFMLRFDGHPGHFFLQRFYLAAPFFVLFSLPLYLIMGLYHSIWKYSGFRGYLTILAAVTIASLPLILARALLFVVVPYGVIGINWFTSLILIGGMRAAARLPGEFGARHGLQRRKRVLIIGAGRVGAMILRELRAPGLHDTFQPVGFIDDDPRKKRALVDGLPVLGSRHDIPAAVRGKNADSIVIALPSAPRGAVREIVAICRETGADLKILPGIYQLIDGQVSVNALRDVAIEDLLGRPPVATDLDEIASYLRGQTVLVTGAGGSIGSELCRQIARFSPAKLILLGRGEHSIYEIHQELTGMGGKGKGIRQEATGERGIEAGVGAGDGGPWASGEPSDPRPTSGETEFIPFIADVRDRERLRQVFARHRPNVIFHAAAHKHVPLMEDAPDEAIKNNVFGTLNAAELAHEYGAGNFVLISTDKAVRPTSVMGATKRAAEMIVQELAGRSATRFCAVRFGNVLGSRGSVIPLFQRQIAAGGPVTVTDPRMVRYFMTTTEAANLVIQAGAMGKGGEIFVLDMGEPVRIMDLARDLIRLSGYEPGKDVEIVVTGPRPGEKLYEEVLTAAEGVRATKHERIYVAGPGLQTGTEVRRVLAELAGAGAEPAAAMETLARLVPGYTAGTGG